MKKLIMIAFAATFSAVANAATVNWSMNSISASPDNSAKNTYMAYIFDTAVGYDSVISALADGDTTVLDSALGSKAVSAAGAVLGAKATTDIYSTGDYVTAFAVILNNSTPANATYFLGVSEVTSGSGVSSAGAVTFGFGSQAANTAWTAVAVPEPTSGLLMLVGLVGLALRRKRA